jgi:hypothetical protein
VGLAKAFQDAPAGATIVYRGPTTQVDIIPMRFDHSTRIDARVRTQTRCAGGWTAEGNAKYEQVNDNWIAGQEQILRDLGIDPNDYAVT